MLTIEDHRRDSVGLTYVYPVISRRAGGLSIGINLNVNNACNWACIYCQVENLQRGVPPAIDLARLQEEIDTLLSAILEGDFLQVAVSPADRTLVDIAFSGNGEPTCATDFLAAVTIARDALAARNLLPQVRLRLITNGSQLHRPAVRAGIALLGDAGGEVWFKLDRVGAASTRLVNGVSLSPRKVLDNLRRSMALAPTWLQTCWFGVDGQAPTQDERQSYCELVHEVAAEIAGIHLYGLARLSQQTGAYRLSRLSFNELEDFAAEIKSKTGARVDINP